MANMQIHTMQFSARLAVEYHTKIHDIIVLKNQKQNKNRLEKFGVCQNNFIFIQWSPVPTDCQNVNGYVKIFSVVRPK